MDNPCNTCNRKVCNISCCDSYLMYREEQSMLKNILTEREYDRLPDQTQYCYWYCDKCGQYILRSYAKKCICEEG